MSIRESVDGVVGPAAWVRCDRCEDWWCRIHAAHVYDYPCPAEEDWPAGWNPYLGGVEVEE